ncbi:hypothetical protein D6789_04445 [Candidatus Woesearchaeota archaeon]|nr:MAG: hypothetical protein D6789_04445 [Candidatus Woesearchaeota archaeon]
MDKGSGECTRGFLKGIIVVLAIILVINVFVLGMQSGELSVSKATVTAKVAGTTQRTVPEEEVPTVDLFVMSECPFGLQMEKALVPVMELLGDNANINVKWVSYLMHGEKERDENTRQYCIQKEQKPLYTKYLRCYIEKGDSSTCQREAGIDTAKLNACVAKAQEEYGIMTSWNDRNSWLSGRYAQFNINKEENERYGVRGSPTLVINGEQVRVSRSPEAVKEAICNTYKNPPKECSAQLSENQEAPGHGPLGVNTGDVAAAAANCGG